MTSNANYGNIPQELKELRQWVCYRTENRHGKPTKVPYQAGRMAGIRAKCNDPATWYAFDQAVEAAGQPKNKLDGIGFVLSDSDPYVFMDLDHVVSDDGTEVWAEEMIQAMGSYTEFSQSGTGIHIIARATKPGGRCRTNTCVQFEMYDRNRFAVFTGHLYPGASAEIREAQAAVDEIYSRVFADESKAQSGRSSAGTGMSSTSDAEIVEKATSAENGEKFQRLWTGDISDYNGDHSAADMALCCMLAFWTERNPASVDRLFRQSGLIRDKWDEHHGDRTYGQMTIGTAIQRTLEVYHGQSEAGSKRSRKPCGAADRSRQSEEHLTDLGNAERLIAVHGSNLRYEVDSQRWLVWDGRLWRWDSTGEVDRLARGVVRGMYDRLKDCGDVKAKDDLYGHIRRSESAPRLAAMVSLARYCLGVPIHSTDLNSDPWLLCCENGTLNLETGKLQASRQEDLISKSTPVRFDPRADCPRWKQFLHEVFCGDEELIGFVRRMCGYMLTGDTREQSFFLFVGKGSNGKSVFTATLSQIMGDYAKDTPVTTFLERRSDSTCDLASLTGARLVTASEGEDTTSFNEALVKRFTGQDPITARHLYQPFFTFMPTFKILFATNEVPRIRSQNYAMKRRVKLIRFRQRFYYPHEHKEPVRDETLAEQLRAEASGILSWAVQGCLEWRKKGLGMPSSMADDVDALFDSMDPLSEFIEDRCIVHPSARVESGTLWREYMAWCEANRVPCAFRRTANFTRALYQRDGIEGKQSNGVRYALGIGLASDCQPEVPCSTAKTDSPGTPSYSPPRMGFPQDGVPAVLGDTAGTRTETDLAAAMPSVPCTTCGNTDWRYEPLAHNGGGAWVCRQCYHATR